MVRALVSWSRGCEFKPSSDHYITTLRPLGKVLTTKVHSLHPGVNGYRIKCHLRMAGPCDLKAVCGLCRLPRELPPGSYCEVVWDCLQWYKTINPHFNFVVTCGAVHARRVSKREVARSIPILGVLVCHNVLALSKPITPHCHPSKSTCVLRSMDTPTRGMYLWCKVLWAAFKLELDSKPYIYIFFLFLVGKVGHIYIYIYIIWNSGF